MQHPIDSKFLEPNAQSTQPDMLICTVLHLMSHYTTNTDNKQGCTKLAAVIERHLKAIAELPQLTPVLKATCQQLSEQWASIVERTMTQPQKTPFLSRLILGAKAAH